MALDKISHLCDAERPDNNNNNDKKEHMLCRLEIQVSCAGTWATSQWPPDVTYCLLTAHCPPPHKKAALPLATPRRAARACSASSRSRTGAGKPQAAIAGFWALRPKAQRSCQMKARGKYKSCRTNQDVWKLFGWRSNTAEDGTEPMEVDPAEGQEEPMEVDPPEGQEEPMEVDATPADLAGYYSAEPGLCLKKGACCAKRVWPHPRLCRHGPSSSAVVRYAAVGKPRP